MTIFVWVSTSTQSGILYSMFFLKTALVHGFFCVYYYVANRGVYGRWGCRSLGSTDISTYQLVPDFTPSRYHLRVRTRNFGTLFVSWFRMTPVFGKRRQLRQMQPVFFFSAIAAYTKHSYFKEGFFDSTASNLFIRWHPSWAHISATVVETSRSGG